MGDSPPILLVRRRLAQNARTCSRYLAKVYDYTPDQLADVPAVVVDMPDWEPLTFGRTGPWGMEIDIHLAIGTSWDADAQKQLDEIQPELYKALESDRTLGGLGTMVISRVIPVKRLDVADIGYTGARFTCEVIAS